MFTQSERTNRFDPATSVADVRSRLDARAERLVPRRGDARRRPVFVHRHRSDAPGTRRHRAAPTRYRPPLSRGSRLARPCSSPRARHPHDTGHRHHRVARHREKWVCNNMCTGCMVIVLRFNGCHIRPRKILNTVGMQFKMGTEVKTTNQVPEVHHNRTRTVSVRTGTNCSTSSYHP
jgi:hypothetical protein